MGMGRVPSYTVPTGPLPSHTWHWAATPPPDLTAAGPTPGTGTYLGQRYGGTCPLHPLGGHTAAQAGCVTAMFPARRPRALGKYFCLVPGPVKSRPCRDHAVTEVQTPEVPLALVPADALPPPSLASHLRQGMAGRGRALTDRLTPLQRAFWPSFSRNGQSCNGLPRRAHHGHNYKCPPSHLSHIDFSPSVPSSDQTSSKQFSCSYLTALKQSVQDTNTALNPQPTKPSRIQQITTLPALHCLPIPPTTVPSASSTARLAHHTSTLTSNASSKTHIRNGRRQHNVFSGAASLAAASLPRPTTKPPSACSPQAELNGSKPGTRTI